MDLTGAIKRIIQTGQVQYGVKTAQKAITMGKAKLIILSSDCPKRLRQNMEKNSKIAQIPIVNYSGTSLELGETCGKPFLVSNLTVLDSGAVNLSELVRKE